MVDGQDEWDEKIKQSLRYAVWLLIKHPKMDPAKITEVLGIKPNSIHVAGAPRRAPNGAPLPGVYHESSWSLRFRVERNRLFFQDVTKLIGALEPHRAFLHQIIDGGGFIELTLHLPGDTNIGDVLRWQDMGRLADLRINLGIEAFPHFK